MAVRVLALIMLLLAGFIFYSSCQAADPAPTPTGTATPRPTLNDSLSSFDSDEVSFSYPSIWNAARYDIVSTRSNLIVYLSTELLHDPCTRTDTSTECVGAPVTQLNPDGVLVGWWQFGTPSWELDESIQEQTLIGGRRATIQQNEASPACTAIGGEEELLVQIEWPGVPANGFEASACVRGPSIDLNGDRIAAMLRTVVWNN